VVADILYGAFPYKLYGDSDDSETLNAIEESAVQSKYYLTLIL
jgi:hypothetical protein